MQLETPARQMRNLKWLPCCVLWAYFSEKIIKPMKTPISIHILSFIKSRQCSSEQPLPQEYFSLISLEQKQ